MDLLEAHMVTGVIVLAVALALLAYKKLRRRRGGR